MKLSADFKIAETKTFRKQLVRYDYEELYSKIQKLVYPQLRTNPYFGPNIKKLKGKFENIYRYRIGKHRLFYTIEKEKVIIFILTITHRKNSYE